MYYFIINPKSRSDRGSKIWKEIAPALKEKNISYQFFLTEYPHHASEIASFICAKESSPVIVVLGGDGTLNEVINGITRPENVVLGYIPTGSSNDFARSLKIPADPWKALDLVLHPGSLKSINIGILRSRTGKKQCFCVSGGIGFDADVTYEALHSKIKNFLNKFHMGKLTYMLIAIKRLILLKTLNGRMILDDIKTISFHNMYFIAIMNHPYEGGGFMMCPAADPCDDYLDILLIHDMPKLKLLLLLPTAFLGGHTHFQGVSVYRCKKVSVETDSPARIHTDGEFYPPSSSFTALCRREKIRVITDK